MTSQRYPEEFKIEAVKQVTDRGRSVAAVSRNLGVSSHSLYAWLKRYGNLKFSSRKKVPSTLKSGGYDRNSGK